MEVTRHSKQLLRLHNLVFVLLFLLAVGLLAWLSVRYNVQADWTATGRNTLSQASVALLDKLQGPVTVTAYARETPLLRQRISELLGRYQRRKPDIELAFVNPDREPQKTRELNIVMDGEMVIEYRGRTEHLREITESGLTNVLQRLARGAERRLLFLTGHGERSPTGNAAYDLSAWARELQSKGVKTEELNLTQTPQVPADAAALIIAAPQVDLLPGEVAAVSDYVARGGNVLWLTDPDQGPHGLQPLAQELGVRFEPGIVVDPNISQVGMMLFGTDDPRIALVASYPPHAITRGFELNTLFPVAGAIGTETGKQWQATPFLKTLSNTWAETGAVSGRITFDEGKDLQGPLDIGVALERPLAKDQAQPPSGDRPGGGTGNGAAADRDAGKAGTQRVVVVGDGDFLSNGFLGLGGNLQLGMNIANWLASDDQLIEIPARAAPDQSLQLSPAKIAVMMSIGAGLPLLLLASGVWIWWRRRRL